jgi:glycosyltransferase involved in cell wall biosynthesis
MSDLSDITILVTTFLRDGYLQDCIAGIYKNLPECHIVVVDDGERSSSIVHSLRKEKWLAMPFDSGLSAKRNAGVKAATTKYVLLGCDDFQFDAEARRGIELMLEALDCFPQLSVASGRVDYRNYEGFLEYVDGEYIKETRADMSPADKDGACQLVDLTVNYFLARTEVLKQFPWPEEMKIGGEHVCLFLDLKLAGKKVAWVKGANINTQPHDPSKQDPRYPEFRARARTLGHPLMKTRYNIKQYIGFEGDVS